jgi:hypothetical protein
MMKDHELFHQAEAGHSIRLLILSCSKAKRQTERPLAAIDVYDGPAFRVLRKFISTSPMRRPLDVAILSAKYGFISPRTRILSYDQRMSAARGPGDRKLYEQLRLSSAGKRYSEIFVNLGTDYISRLPHLPSLLEGNPIVTMAKGRIGRRLHDMKEWLFEV